MKKAKKPKTSIFYITINMQKYLNDDQTEKFKKTLEHIFKRENIGKYLTNKDGEYDDSKLIDYKSKFVVEVGKKYSKTHAHAIIKCAHFMKLQINKKNIENYYNKFLVNGLKFSNGQIYTHFNGKPDDKKNWESYMFKDVTDDDEEAAHKEELKNIEKKNRKKK